MGTRWEGVLTRATPEALADLPSLALPLCGRVVPAVRVDLNAGSHPAAPGVWVLELTGINRNPLQVQARAGVRPDTLGGLPPAVVDLASSSPQFELALLTAEHLGKATWIFHSDTLAQSSSVALEGAAVGACQWRDSDTGEDYGAAAVASIARFVPSVQCVDDLLDMLYGPEASWLGWRLMESKQVLSAPRPFTNLAGRS